MLKWVQNNSVLKTPKYFTSLKMTYMHNDTAYIQWTYEDKIMIVHVHLKLKSVKKKKKNHDEEEAVG